MRIFTHSRGVPPKLRSSTVRAFMPDKNFTSIGGLEDIIDASYSLSPNATVDLSDCPVSGARLYPGDRYIRDGSGASGDHAIFTDECTWQMWLYIDSDQVKSSAYAFSYGQQGETSATNILMSVKAQEVSGTLRLRSFWEYASGTNQEATSSLSPPVDEWCHIAMVREDDPNNAGKCRMRFYVNGCQMRDANGDPEFLDNSGAGFEYPAGGTSSRWAIGGLYGSTSFYFTGRIGPVMVYSEALTDADIQEDYRRGLGWATGNRVHIRVLAEDNFGNMQNLSAVPAPNGETVDMLQGVRIDDSVDKRVTTGTVNLFRGHGRINLSPLMSESFLNRSTSTNTLADRTNSTLTQTSYTAPTDVDPTTFLNIGRFIRIQMSRMPYGLSPDEITSLSLTGTDWYDLLVGYVDVVDFGKDVISLNVRDQGGLLADMFIEADDEEDVRRFVPNNTSLYDAIDNIIDENWTSPFGIATYPVLYEPVASQWALAEGTVPRDLVLSSINKLASQIAWMVRFKWDKGFGAGRQDFRLTLHEPDREKVISDSFISAEDYVDLSKLSLDISGVRNAVKIAYWAPEFETTLPYGLRSTGDFPMLRQPSTLAAVQKTITYEDDDSIAKYGRRYMELQESAEDLIDSTTEADRMGNGILNDLKEPLAHTSLNAKDLVEVELNDLLSIEANYQSFDSSQNYAVSTVNMDMKNGFVDVSFGLRGTPSSGSDRHISMERTSLSGPQTSYGAADNNRPTLTALSSHVNPIRAIGPFGGVEPSIPNQNFEQWGGGNGGYISEPIGWTTTGGTWGSGDDLYVKAIGDGVVPGQTGSFLIDMNVNTAAITSEYFFISAGKPYVVKMRAAVTNLSNTIGGTVKFYATRKDTAPIATGGTETLTSVALSAVNLVEEKQFYVNAPAGAAFARVEVSPGTVSASSNVYLDSIRLTECEPFTRASPSTSYSAIGLASKTFETYTVVGLNSVDVDIGGNFTPGGTHVYTVPEDGLYKINACVSMVSTTTNATPGFNGDSDIDLLKGGNAVTAILKAGDPTPNTIIAYGSPGSPHRIDASGGNYDFAASSHVEIKKQMTKGQKVQLGWAGNIYNVYAAMLIDAETTFLEVTLLNGEKR